MTSSFVMVHDLISPGFSVIEPSDAQSPVIVDVYPGSVVSLTV